jgi:hypothetical protein
MAGFFNSRLRARVRAQQAKAHAKRLGAARGSTALETMTPPHGGTHSARTTTQQPITGPNRGRGGK